MMSNKHTNEGCLKGELPLPATFTTGYKRDLETAREMIRASKGSKPDNSVAAQTDHPTGAPQVQYG